MFKGVAHGPVVVYFHRRSSISIPCASRRSRRVPERRNTPFCTKPRRPDNDGAAHQLAEAPTAQTAKYHPASLHRLVVPECGDFRQNVLSEERELVAAAVASEREPSTVLRPLTGSPDYISSCSCVVPRVPRVVRACVRASVRRSSVRPLPDLPSTGWNRPNT